MARSDWTGALNPSPSAASVARASVTNVRSSAGSREAWWSGPGSERSRVKCFSKSSAPMATAAMLRLIPWLWSLHPAGTCSSDRIVAIARRLHSSGTAFVERRGEKHDAALNRMRAQLGEHIERQCELAHHGQLRLVPSGYHPFGVEGLELDRIRAGISGRVHQAMREARAAVVIHAGLGNHKTTRTPSNLPILDPYWWHLASRMPPPVAPPRG